MSQKRKRGNGEGTVFKRADDGPYYLSWYDADGKRKSMNTKTTDKQAAQRILGKKLADVALRRNGIIDVRQESLAIQSGRPIEEHLADFKAMLTARQRSQDHIERTVAFIREVCQAAGFERPSDVTADGVNKFIADMKAKDNAARTIQGRVVAVKAFTKWLTDHGKLGHDPLRSVKRPSVKTDRRLRRRMLLPAEWPYLRAATLASGPRYEMSPMERALLYAVAIQTGLRSAELRSITKADLFLAGDTPFVRCRAENTKNGKEARQYIQADLAAELRILAASKTPAAPAFNLPDEWDMATMLRADLDAARQQWLDEVRHDAEALANRTESDFLAVRNREGEDLDFHALRHTTGSWLALQGLHPNVIKTVMRHSTITLTMDTYGHLLPDQHVEAISSMASMMGSEMRAAVGAAVEVPKRDPSGAKKCASMRSHSSGNGQTTRRKSLPVAEVCEAVRNDAMKSKTGPAWIRTMNQGIMSPLLCR